MHRPCARALHRFLRENWQLLLTLFPHCSTHRTEWPLVLIRCSLPPGAFRYPFSHLLGAWWQQLFQLSPLQQAATPCLFRSSVTAPTGAAWWSMVVSRGLVWWHLMGGWGWEGWGLAVRLDKVMITVVMAEEFRERDEWYRKMRRNAAEVLWQRAEQSAIKKW